MKSILTSEVYEPVLPGRQHHCQSRPLHVGQSSQLRICHGCSLCIREHADLSVVEHHLQDTVRVAQTRQKPQSQKDIIVIVRRLTANLSGGIIEMATGKTPSICSFTKADIAMSGRPAGGREGTNISIRKLLFVPSIILLTLKVDISPPIPARTPISMKTSAPHELIGPKVRLWLSKLTRTSSCSSEHESFN